DSSCFVRSFLEPAGITAPQDRHAIPVDLLRTTVAPLDFLASPGFPSPDSGLPRFDLEPALAATCQVPSNSPSAKIPRFSCPAGTTDGWYRPRVVPADDGGPGLERSNRGWRTGPPSPRSCWTPAEDAGASISESVPRVIGRQHISGGGWIVAAPGLPEARAPFDSADADRVPDNAAGFLPRPGTRHDSTAA